MAGSCAWVLGVGCAGVLQLLCMGELIYASGYADGELLCAGLLRGGLESFKEKCSFSEM